MGELPFRKWLFFRLCKTIESPAPFMNANEVKITMDTMKKRLMTVNEIVKKFLAN